jgi:hypothetical protein
MSSSFDEADTIADRMRKGQASAKPIWRQCSQLYADAT